MQALFRYVDDIRVYLKPIRACWKWKNKRWELDQTVVNKQGDLEHTVRELGKSMNDIWKFLSFTTESELDFDNKYLPTLDFATKVNDNGFISYKFFSKPMSSNLVLQKGTALSAGCIFSSLRQDLVRRLLNTDTSQPTDVRLKIINEFIQNMTNSGHVFIYIKSVVLQALSKYVYMVGRSELNQDHKRYAPLHRTRFYNNEIRKLRKYTNHALWYTGDN